MKWFLALLIEVILFEFSIQQVHVASAIFEEGEWYGDILDWKVWLPCKGVFNKYMSELREYLGKAK